MSPRSGHRLPPTVAIVQQADRFDVLRCRCTKCLRLDARHPGQGFQLALFPYTVQRKPRRGTTT